MSAVPWRALQSLGGLVLVASTSACSLGHVLAVRPICDPPRVVGQCAEPTDKRLSAGSANFECNVAGHVTVPNLLECGRREASCHGNPACLDDAKDCRQEHYCDEIKVHAGWWGLAPAMMDATCGGGMGLQEIIIRQTGGDHLMAVLTLGIYAPMRVKWKCAAPNAEGGELPALPSVPTASPTSAPEGPR